VQLEEDKLGKVNEASALHKDLGKISKKVFVQVLSKVAMV